MRYRSPSYSPPPRRGYYGRSRRSPSLSPSPTPRGRYGGRSRDPPTSLLVRNIRRDCRPDDLREPFREFGPIKDIYLPRDYYTGEPRGFGFVQYFDPADAAEAKYSMDRQILHGQEIAVVFAGESRKKPSEMRNKQERLRSLSDDAVSNPVIIYRSRERYGRHCSPYFGRSPSYSPSWSRRCYSPSQRRSPRRGRYSRSVSPYDNRRYGDYSYSYSSVSKSTSPSRSDSYMSRERSQSRSVSPASERGTGSRTQRERSLSGSRSYSESSDRNGRYAFSRGRRQESSRETVESPERYRVRLSSHHSFSPRSRKY